MFPQLWPQVIEVIPETPLYFHIWLNFTVFWAKLMTIKAPNDKMAPDLGIS